jgi:hypothetical protein
MRWNGEEIFLMMTRGGRLVGRVVVVFLSSIVLVGVAAGGAFAAGGGCPNELLREETHSTRLPDCRAYELVSPAFKNGYPVYVTPSTSGVAVDGESAFFSSIGAFNGSGEDYALNPYLAKRTPSGWVTTGLFPPLIEGELLAGFEEKSSSLSQFEYLSNNVSTASERLETPSSTLWVRRPDGSFERSSPVMTTAAGVPFTSNVVGAADDFSRFVMSHTDPAVAHILGVAGDETEDGEQLFEVERSGLRLVAVGDGGEQLTRYCSVFLGGPDHGVGSVSQPDAAKVFFSVSLNTTSSAGGGCGDNATSPIELFVRVDGSRTVRVSAPLPEDCTEEPCLAAASATPKEAVFQGASEDGSRVYFTTSQPLVNGDKDQANDLYMATLGVNGSGEPAVTSLTQISHDSTGAAEVEGPRVLAVSPDGSHVYFVARGVLASGVNGEGEAAVAGAENLYVYDAEDEQVSFVADLCSGAESSGVVTDSRCPVSLGGKVNDDRLWGIDSQEAQTTDDGKFLVFSTYARLIGSGPEADTDTAKDVYRYDSVTGTIRRVSLGEKGADGNGNNDLFDAGIDEQRFHGPAQEQYELERRAISDDGSTIVFTTSEPLSTRAVNGLTNIYEWHENPGTGEGGVSMISTGVATDIDTEPVITPSGRDIFFITSSGLVANDTDGLRDMYDARIGGGFPPSPAAKEECTGDGCQGPLSAPAPLLVPGSVSQPAGGNLPAPVAASAQPKPVSTKPKPKKKTKKKAKPKKKHERKAAGSRIATRGQKSKVGRSARAHDTGVVLEGRRG